ncbi:MAG TPA: ABC transporter substrate-binding protein [Nitrospirota bacterium]|nr:ABC transporter substrate-binding protein [Nitrospirota bacterium]
MNRTVCRLFIFVLAVAVSMGIVSVEARAEKKIGVLLWSEESRYADSKNGIMEQLKKGGFGENTVKFTVENAGGNKAKAAEFAQKFAAAKLDMVIVVGTSAAVAVAGAIKTVPVVFSMVYDPVDAKIAEDWKSSGNNTTGASPRVPMAKLVGSLKQLAPVKKLAVLYTPGEKNSETQLKEIQAVQTETQIKVVPVPLTSKETLSSIVSDVTGAADAIYLSGSSIVGGSVSIIVDIATKAKIITVTHLDDLVDKGVLLGVCANPYQVGALAGEKAVKVLKGAKPSSVPIESLKKLDVIVNMKTAKAGQIQIPPVFLKAATKVIE